jgi:undecaprenyl-diphosphatase
VTYFNAALLGILQGLTEFLPVSSTAHLLIAERLLGYQDPGGTFTVMIQLGSILAIVWLYRRTIVDVLAGLGTDLDARRFAIMILVAFVPAAVVGGLFGKFVKSVLYESPGVFAVAFILGGFVILLVERLRPKPTILDAERVPVSRALGVGVCQTLALVPGVSRSGATIVGGLVMGFDRAAAAEFSFFLAIPTMTAAFAKSLLDVRGQLAGARVTEIGIGFVTAFIASALVVRPFLGYVRRSGFTSFAWYRIAAGAALLAALAAGWR